MKYKLILPWLVFEVPPFFSFRSCILLEMVYNDPFKKANALIMYIDKYRRDKMDELSDV